MNDITTIKARINQLSISQSLTPALVQQYVGGLLDDGCVQEMQKTSEALKQLKKDSQKTPEQQFTELKRFFFADGDSWLGDMTKTERRVLFDEYYEAILIMQDAWKNTPKSTNKEDIDEINKLIINKINELFITPEEDTQNGPTEKNTQNPRQISREVIRNNINKIIKQLQSSDNTLDNTKTVTSLLRCHKRLNDHLTLLTKIIDQDPASHEAWNTIKSADIIKTTLTCSPKKNKTITPLSTLPALGAFQNLQEALSNLNLADYIVDIPETLKYSSYIKSVRKNALERWPEIIIHNATTLGGAEFKEFLEAATINDLDNYIKTHENIQGQGEIVGLCKACRILAQKIENKAFNLSTQATPAQTPALYTVIFGMTNQVLEQVRNDQIQNGSLDDGCLKLLHTMQKEFINNSDIKNKLDACINFFEHTPVRDKTFWNRSTMFATALQQARELQKEDENLTQEFKRLKKDQQINTQAINYSEYFKEQAQAQSQETISPKLEEFHEKIKALHDKVGTTQEIFNHFQNPTTQQNPTNNTPNKPFDSFENYLCNNKESYDPKQYQANLLLLSFVAYWKEQPSKTNLLNTINSHLGTNYSEITDLVKNITEDQLLLLKIIRDQQFSYENNSEFHDIPSFIDQLVSMHNQIFQKTIDFSSYDPQYNNESNTVLEQAYQKLTDQLPESLRPNKNIVQQAQAAGSAVVGFLTNTFSNLFNFNTDDPFQLLQINLLKGAPLQKSLEAYLNSGYFQKPDNKELKKTRIYLSVQLLQNQISKNNLPKDKTLLDLIQLYKQKRTEYPFATYMNDIIPNLNIEQLDLSQDPEPKELEQQFKNNKAINALLLTHKLKKPPTNQNFIEEFMLSCDQAPQQNILKYLLKLQDANQFDKFKEKVLNEYKTNTKATNLLLESTNSTTSIKDSIKYSLEVDQLDLEDASKCYTKADKYEWLCSVSKLLDDIGSIDNKLEDKNKKNKKRLKYLDQLRDGIDDKDLKNANFMQLMCLYYMIKVGYTGVKNDPQENYLTQLEQLIACFPLNQYFAEAELENTPNPFQQLYKLAKFCFENDKLSELKTKSIKQLLQDQKNHNNIFYRYLGKAYSWAKNHQLEAFGVILIMAAIGVGTLGSGLAFVAMLLVGCGMACTFGPSIMKQLQSKIPRLWPQEEVDESHDFTYNPQLCSTKNIQNKLQKNDNGLGDTVYVQAQYFKKLDDIKPEPANPTTTHQEAQNNNNVKTTNKQGDVSSTHRRSPNI